MTKEEVLKLVQQAIDDEPEFPGYIPEEMYQAIVNGDRATVSEALRISVRLTKNGILQRIENRLK